MLDLSKRTLLSHMQEVRSLLNDTGCMDSNPFFVKQDGGELTKLFTLFATDVENAAEKLGAVIGVENGIKNVSPESIDYAANGLVAGSGLEEREVYLSKTFDAARIKPYFALCKVEDLVKNNKAIHPLTAQETMDGLKNLYVVVKAIPAVYAKTLEMNS